MTRRAYLLTEGVHDVAVLSRILRKRFGGKQIAELDKLEPSLHAWIDTSFKWPVKGKIDRMAVPAPEVYFLQPSELWVTVSSAEGIDKIKSRLDTDFEAFDRAGTKIEAWGIICDADKIVSARELATRFRDVATLLEQLSLPRPKVLGEVAGAPRTGVFILPDCDKAGTLEDILVPLGESVYPKLFESARTFVEEAKAGLDELERHERAEIGAPAGSKKALLSAVSAILKPGKAIQSTLRDHRWISKETLNAAELRPLIHFLTQLLSPESNPG